MVLMQLELAGITHMSSAKDDASTNVHDPKGPAG
jgi:hypothetical protein